MHPPDADFLYACVGFYLVGLLFCFGEICIEVGQGSEVEEGGFGGGLGEEGRGKAVSGEFGERTRVVGGGRVAHRIMLRLLFIIGSASTDNQSLPDHPVRSGPDDWPLGEGEAYTARKGAI